MSETVYVIEHGSTPRPARVTKAYITPDGDIGSTYVEVAFTDERGGSRRCLASSVHPTKAEAERAEREMEKR